MADQLVETGVLAGGLRRLKDMGDGSYAEVVVATGRPIIVKDIPSTAVVAGTPLTVWTPTSGKKFRLMGWALSLSVAGSLIFKYAAANTLGFRTPAVAAAGMHQEDWFGDGYMPGAANDALKVDVTTNGNVAGYVFGTEE